MFAGSPITYIDPLFRPPSEARSFILQVTNGCSWNQCTFCDMYTQPQKKFRAKAEEAVLEEIRWARDHLTGFRRIFLADGDPLVLPTRRLLVILGAIRENFPHINRVSAYCLPRNVSSKTDQELKDLSEAGLDLIYLGAESGDDFVLQSINKGESRQGTILALNRLRDAGIRRSVMIINGLAGARFSEQHALHSATLANETQPEYLASLVINLPHGEARHQAGFNGQFERMPQHALFAELRHFVAALELKATIFRSDHASNQLVLKGVLGKDKTKLLDQIDLAVSSPAQANLRPVWTRPF